MKQLIILSLLCAAGTFADGLQIIGDQFLFTEGPAADAAGNIYFTDLRIDRIYVYTRAGETKVFRENSGGANGLYFDRDGNLLICEGNKKRITALASDGTLTALACGYDGNPLNKPNDLWIDPKGGIYFTDPIYGKVQKTQDGEHVYYIAPDRSRISRVIDDFIRPNGIIGTPDGKTLYVADHGDSKIWKYEINEDGSLREKTFFAAVRSDGMTLDSAGNLYATETSVLILNPSGERIGEIKTPDRPTNVTIKNETLYITARTHFCSIKIKGGSK
jgi:gluconolactonase